jgi:hypothetical protein
MNLLGIKSLFTREAALPELQSVVDGFSTYVSSRRHRAEVQLSVISSVLKLLHKEAPRFESPISFALEPYRQISTAETQFALVEERLRDDLLDIVERAKIVQRVQDEYTQSLEQLQTAKTALTQAHMLLMTLKDESGVRRQKAEQDFALATSDKRDKVLKAQSVTRQLLNLKKKFATFRLNRLRHGWAVYSEALTQCGRIEAEAYGAMAASLVDIRRRIGDLAGPVGGDAAEVVDVVAQPGTAKVADFPNPFE